MFTLNTTSGMFLSSFVIREVLRPEYLNINRRDTINSAPQYNGRLFEKGQNTNTAPIYDSQPVTSKKTYRRQSELVILNNEQYFR